MKSSLFALSLALVAASASFAEEVEVSGVRFSPSVRSATGTNWFEADVALDVKPAAIAAGRMVSRVRVTLTLQFELPAAAGADRHSEFYRADAECVALEPGRADVRFYLPPELVKRDQLHGEPKWWGVELAVGGRPVTAGRAAYSAVLAAVDARKNFQTHAAAAAAVNDGLLQPQFLTPFANDYPRATPSFVRREPR